MNIRTAIIFAAGDGTRFRPYSQKTPKTLFQINGEALLARHIRQLNTVFDLEEIIVLAIQAGNDILQFSNPTELDEAFPILFQTIVKDALQNGDIDMSLIDAAFQRISDLKYRLLEFE